MNSFDFFDTLVARRSIFPFTDESDPQLEREETELIPIRDNIRFVRPGDIIVSDFYASREWMQAQLKRVTGLENEIIVSRDGKQTGRVWQQLRDQGRLPYRHMGDHQLLDVDGPRHHGILTELTSLARPTDVERHFISQGLPQLGHLLREARLSCHDPKYPEIRDSQTQANFPMLLLASILLGRWVDSNQLERVLISGRDGYLWFLLLDELLNVDVQYFLTSRVCRINPSPGYLSYVRRLVEGQRAGIVDLCGTGYSLRRLMQHPGTECPTFLLAWYGDGQNNEYESLQTTSNEVPEYILKTSLAELEIANYANQNMVIDVEPQYANPTVLETDFDWVGCREIDTARNAFEACIQALGNYPGLVTQLLRLSDDFLKWQVSEFCQRLSTYWKFLDFARDAHRTEELQIRKMMGFKDEQV